ncbi:ATP-binding protein [Bdellovibrio sp. 22V]|uniref:ATP-binding protein n=1 Tax=Bdellovibrio TaxID=958 RepID=UPI0025431EAC|nr:ATP-binding protein [Bdellovibrio sp. 22V]WII72713.1 ATP-binding protein [Bdellovibrio sp. 22V]
MKQNQARNHPEVEKIFQQQAHEICVRMDRGFAFLMIIQWVACVLLGIYITPGTWLGQFSGSLENALVGVIFGGLFALPSLYCALILPGQKITRVVISVAQMCFSILLIYLTGGRIETHFHVFVSLAALAFYKDISILLLASLIVIIDHALRGILLPMTVYGEGVGMEWRWVEHALWVAFEDIILILGIGRIREELKDMAYSKYELMSAREDALRLSSLKSSFLSNMSHEIRTPLNSIIGFSDILRDTKLDEEQTEYVGTIHRCSDSLLHLINDILDISKIENGLLQIDRHRFDFKELHSDIHKMFSVKCQEKGLELELEMDEEIPRHAMGDSHRLRQVLTNLVGNAVKFTEKGKVRIAVRKDIKTQTYRWHVQDTGKGIHYDNIKKLFRSFYQEDASVSRKYGGSGLGLMISKNLVELMGGQISVDSKVGEGTTFSFSLPLEEVN